MYSQKTRLILFTAVLVLSAAGQIAAKAGALRAGAGRIVNALFLISLFCLFARGLLWTIVLRGERLVFAYPIMALTYPLILILSWLFFGESLTVGKAAGSLLVVAGVGVTALAEVSG